MNTFDTETKTSCFNNFGIAMSDFTTIRLIHVYIKLKFWLNIDYCIVSKDSKIRQTATTNVGFVARK